MGGLQRHPQHQGPQHNDQHHPGRYHFDPSEPEPGEILEGTARDLCHTKAHRRAFKVFRVQETCLDCGLQQSQVESSQEIKQGEEAERPAQCYGLRAFSAFHSIVRILSSNVTVVSEVEAIFAEYM